jgi:SAM-dependent methyltransferase
MESPHGSEKRKQMARWLSGSGIEIGALHNPLSVPSGVEVRYVDRLAEGQLRQHYPELSSEKFVPISLIGDAQDLSCLSGDTVDFVIANHLLEHLDNPIQGLREMVRVLRPGGVLYLALPDPRVTFDFERELTKVEHVLDEYRYGPESTRRAHFTEWVEKVEPHTHFGPADDVEARVQELMDGDYSIHYHVWRPDTFSDFLAAARAATGIELDLVGFAPCDNDNEFIFVLLKGIAQPPRAIPPLVAVGPVHRLSIDTTEEVTTEASRDTEVELPPAPTTAARRLKQSIGASPVGPILRPIYRLVFRHRPARRK